MNNVKIVSICFLLATFQSYSQGFVFNEEVKESLNQFEQTEITKDVLPTQKSLKKYCPFVHYQLGSECVAYSFANAMTILMAIKNNITDTKDISANSFSPYFVYYRNKDEGDNKCDQGLNPVKVAIDVKNNGIAHLANVECPDYYPCQDAPPQLCNYYPPNLSSDLIDAKQNRLKDVYVLESVQQIKTALHNDHPVVIGMMVPESFNTSGSTWSPISSETVENGYGHAMVAVGYNDNINGGVFEILNSWGNGWGNEGYVYVRYKDFLKFFVLGFELVPMNNFGSSNLSENQEQIEEQTKIDKKKLKKDQKLSNSNTIPIGTNNYLIIRD